MHESGAYDKCPLNNCGFVIKRNVGKRTYYKLNKKQFIDASRLLRRYVEGYDL